MCVPVCVSMCVCVFFCVCACACLRVSVCLRLVYAQGIVITWIWVSTFCLILRLKRLALDLKT